MMPETPSMPQTFSHYPTWPLPVVRGGGLGGAEAGEAGRRGGETPALAITGKSVCGYLPNRMTLFRAFEAEELSAETYQRLMDAGFRRSGTLVYQPMCPGCRACVPIRVPVGRFRPSRSQRRVLRKNQDVQVTVSIPAPSVEKYELYDRYQRQWHDGKQAGDPMGFLTFLHQSPVHTLEFEYRDPGAGSQDEHLRGGKLLGVGICDLTPRALSSVYFYFDPADARRSLGTFSVLYELAWAREHALAYWYAGYWVKGCATMEYKARYQPAEVLGTDGAWRAMDGPKADMAAVDRG
jgi:arginine-tRNA-protein transferase